MPNTEGTQLFVSTTGTRLIYECVRDTFTGLRRVAGLQPSSGPAPRIHDLRHSFAVQTLLEWHRAGIDVGAQLPLLWHGWVTATLRRPTTTCRPRRSCWRSPPNASPPSERCHERLAPTMQSLTGPRDQLLAFLESL